MPYMNIDEVDAAVVSLAAAHPTLTELITLPNATIEGRTTHAIRIGAANASARDGMFVTGGVHAREWGSCEICINFAADLLDAYTGSTGLAYGGTTFTAANVAAIVESLNVFVFPCVNPDGRKFSQETVALWRRNRNAAESGGNADCIGVDLNRNYDFLWDFPNLFSASAGVHTSTSPCDASQVYRGSAAGSEPETGNVQWMLDNFPRIRWFVDLHSSGQDILFSWGDDENQSADASMNFLNSGFNSTRGVGGDSAYQEFIPADDLSAAESIADAMHDAILGVRGTDYAVFQAYGLYPTSGAGDDYSYSRHFADPGKGKVLAYTVEWGTEFQPAWSEMEQIISDISAGLVRFCLRAPCATDGNQVTLETPSLNFNDVPEGQTTVRAVVFQVVSCAARTFQIVSGPTKLTGPAATTFGTPLGATTPLSATTDLSVPREARLWVSFTGTAAGDNATGTLTVQLNETGEQWIIPITTHTIARPRALVGMVLDQSGSMDWDAGDGRTRMQVLHDAAAPFIDVMYENDALAVVGFDEDAHDEMGITVMGPATPFDAGRVAARAAIAAHHTNPAGATSIGDGIERAHQIVNPEAGYDVKALVVLTDGQENTPAFIADVAGDINQYVFAIGLGTTQEVNPVALNAIANGSGGYLLMTGTLGTDDFFRLSKYYQQILAGVTNTDIVLDPEGYISTGQRQKIPFRLTEADIQSDVVLLTPTPWLVQFSLETPDGTVITPADAGVTPGMNYYQSNNVSYYRMTLPVPVGAHGAKAGQWHAVLETSRRLPGGTVEGSGGQKNTVHYSLSVRSFSNLRMRGRLLQNSNEPGATMTLRAVLTEYDLPVEDRAKVRAQLERPDGTKATLALKEVEPGVFETHMTAAIPGIYSFRLMAAGKTLRGQPFTREQLLTGAVWRGGDQNPPTGGGPGGPGKDKPCCLLNCLTSPKVLTPRFEELAKQWGINLEGLRACHKSCCSK